MTTSPLIPTAIVPSVGRIDLPAKAVERELVGLLSSGAKLRIAGKAKSLANLFAKRLKPKHKLEIFDTAFYLTNVCQMPELRFLVGYVVQRNAKSKKPEVFPRVFYKDLSLSWRAASHFSISDGDIWVGKGDVRLEEDGEHQYVTSEESTTELPLEIQTGIESLLGLSGKPIRGDGILDLIVKKAPPSRVEPYRDFVMPRRLAVANARNLINRGKTIANFRRSGDPTSLKITKGFEPDFENGIVERSHSRSKLYGGKLKRFRILSTNKKVQYYFVAGPKHIWLYPIQATTTQLSSFGVRTIDVVAHEDLFLPGYEYHHYEETSDGREELYSQIPEGFAGEECPVDDAKADASPWLNKIPLIQNFRKEVLKRS